MFWVGYAPIDVGLRRKVHYDVCFLESLADERVLSKISSDKPIPRVLSEFPNIGLIATYPFEVYVGDSQVLPGLDYVMDEIASNEP